MTSTSAFSVYFGNRLAGGGGGEKGRGLSLAGKLR
jgi:hypothetical protein